MSRPDIIRSQLHASLQKQSCYFTTAKYLIGIVAHDYPYYVNFMCWKKFMQWDLILE